MSDEFNPYASPQATVAPLSSSFHAHKYVRLSTRIVVNGCNILGILLLALTVSPALVVLIPGIEIPRWLIVSGIGSGALAAMMDMWWRRQSSAEISWKRWLSPFEGGTLFFLPSWLLGMITATSVAVLLAFVLFIKK